MLHIKIYTHAPTELVPMLEDIMAAVDKIAVDAGRKLMDLGLIKDDSEELIELNLMSNEQIAEINRTLRKKDGPTDVISLKLSDSSQDIHSPDLPEEIFGEIFISVEKCNAQAQEIGQSFLEEFAFLLVHGILHIFDYDHETPAEEEEMMQVAYEILGRDKAAV